MEQPFSAEYRLDALRRAYKDIKEERDSLIVRNRELEDAINYVKDFISGGIVDDVSDDNSKSPE